MKPYSSKWEKAVIASARKVLKKKGEKPTLNLEQARIYNWWTETESTFIQILGGERSGKSWLTALLLALCVKPGSKHTPDLYWVVGPDYRQARPEFEYLYAIFMEMGLVESASMPVSESAPWSMTLVIGVTIQTRSSADFTKLASFSVYGVAMAEAAQQLYDIFYKLLGRLSETGGPLIVSGTLERSLPWYADLYARWQAPNPLGAKSFSLPTWSNTDVFPLGREDPAIKKLESEFPPDLFMERFGGVPSAPVGVVLPEFSMQKHVKHLEYDRSGSPVRLCIDPGYKAYAIGFVQHNGLYTHVLDRIYARGRIVQDIIPEAMANPLWKYIDPDRAGRIDQAGQQHSGSYSQVELWRDLAGIHLESEYIFEEDTIRTLRYRLGERNPEHEPLLYFNDHFTNARSQSGEALDVLAEPLLWRWPDRGFRKNEPRRPVDNNNHFMKAVGYELVGWFGAALESNLQRTVIRRSYWI